MCTVNRHVSELQHFASRFLENQRASVLAALKRAPVSEWKTLLSTFQGSCAASVTRKNWKEREWVGRGISPAALTIIRRKTDETLPPLITGIQLQERNLCSVDLKPLSGKGLCWTKYSDRTLFELLERHTLALLPGYSIFFVFLYSKQKVSGCALSICLQGTSVI